MRDRSAAGIRNTVSGSMIASRGLHKRHRAACQACVSLHTSLRDRRNRDLVPHASHMPLCEPAIPQAARATQNPHTHVSERLYCGPPKAHHHSLGLAMCVLRWAWQQ